MITEELRDLTHYRDAAAWVFITAFAGLAISWSSGVTPAWVGALIGGGVAFLTGAAVIATRDHPGGAVGDPRGT